MNDETKIVVGIGMLGLLIYLNGLNQVKENASFKLRGFKFGGFNGTNFYFLTDLQIDNPTASTMSINGITGDIFIAGDPVARIHNLAPFTISPKQRTIVPVRLIVEDANLVSRLKDLLKTGKIPEVVAAYSIVTPEFRYTYNEPIFNI